MLQQIIGYAHLFALIFRNIYGFIIPKNAIFDILYILLFLILPFVWFFYNGECPITYYFKKHYKNKDNSSNQQDLIELFYNKEQFDIFHNIITIVYIISLILVNTRSKVVNNYFFIPSIILFIIYAKFRKLITKESLTTFQQVYGVVLIVNIYSIITTLKV